MSLSTSRLPLRGALQHLAVDGVCLRVVLRVVTHVGHPQQTGPPKVVRIHELGEAAERSLCHDGSAERELQAPKPRHGRVGLCTQTSPPLYHSEKHSRPREVVKRDVRVSQPCGNDCIGREPAP
jgi:hypothetical protein